MAHAVSLGAIYFLSSQVLFLCSGNYYRSRFAEILFNHLAAENNLDWHAESRGIIAQWSRNPGPISSNTLAELKSRNIPVDTSRYPMQVTPEDFAVAQWVVALYDAEHRSMMENYFPDHLPAVEFWNVPDLDEMDSTQALALIDQNVRSLIARFASVPARP